MLTTVVVRSKYSLRKTDQKINLLTLFQSKIRFKNIWKKEVSIKKRLKDKTSSLFPNDF